MTEKQRDTEISKEEENLQNDLKTSEEVKTYFRSTLVPNAIEAYMYLLADPDPKIRKDAADSIMKIEGSLGGKDAVSSGGITFNFDMNQLSGMADALKSVGNGKTRNITDE